MTVFDTAPTGHTLRLLGLPDVVQKLLALKSKFLPMISAVCPHVWNNNVKIQMAPMMGIPPEAVASMVNNEAFEDKSKQVLELFHDHVCVSFHAYIYPLKERTTFVCVCIAEFLSLYETERLIQELVRMDIDVRNIIVNQLIPQGFQLS